jgi:hypothetical protein
MVMDDSAMLVEKITYGDADKQEYTMVAFQKNSR